MKMSHISHMSHTPKTHPRSYPKNHNLLLASTNALDRTGDVINHDAWIKNGGLDKFLNKIDIKNIVLETDAPYLSPVPFRGKRNESSYIMYVIDKLSEIYNLKSEEIIYQTSLNANDVFNINK